MRLLDSTTLEFQEFFDNRIPKYMILSHTWGPKEVTYQDMRYLQKLRKLPESMCQSRESMVALEIAAGMEVGQGDAMDIEARSGYRKIRRTAAIAKHSGYRWFWIDTCCIDKSSSAELQEAINSMYKWYQRSHSCIVHLDGVTLDSNSAGIHQFYRLINGSNWISRGWTLQELIAPRFVKFYDGEWNYIYHKHMVLRELREVTGIPEVVLATGDLGSTSVAQKMSWAAHRQTTRLEDEAYSLLGIFDVQMPMLYGEGKKAFFRLQENIIRMTADDSIFAWEAMEAKSTIYRGLFARSPREFEHCAQVIGGEGKFELSNFGLQADLALEDPRIDDIFVAYLQARRLNYNDQTLWPIRIILRRLSTKNNICKYARVFPPLDLPSRLGFLSAYDRTFPVREFDGRRRNISTAISTVYVDIMPSLPPQLSIPVIRCFSFKRGPQERSRFQTMIGDTYPREQWDERTQTLKAPADLLTFVGILEVLNTHQWSYKVRKGNFQLMVCFNQLERQAWAKVLPLETIDLSKDHGLESLVKRTDAFPTITTQREENRWIPPSGDGVGVLMKYGLLRDEVSVIVEIEGLIKF